MFSKQYSVVDSRVTLLLARTHTYVSVKSATNIVSTSKLRVFNYNYGAGVSNTSRAFNNTYLNILFYSGTNF